MTEGPGLGSRIRGFFTLRMATTFLMATGLTAVVAGPLAYEANEARQDDGAVIEVDPVRQPEPGAGESETGAAEEPAAEPTPDVLEGVERTGILVDGQQGSFVELDGVTLSGSRFIIFDDDELAAVAYALYDGSNQEVFTGNDQRGPAFDLLPTEDGGAEPLDTTVLADDEYDLLVTLTFEDGSIDRRVAEFTIANDDVGANGEVGE